MIVQRFPLTRHQDERGWFAELARSSALPKPMRQANLVWSRKGVIRALHYHERGQDDRTIHAPSPASASPSSFERP